MVKFLTVGNNMLDMDDGMESDLRFRADDYNMTLVMAKNSQNTGGTAIAGERDEPCSSQ